MKGESALSRTIEGVGLLMGAIIGAGLFALPYSFARSGLAWGLALFGTVLAISLAFHFLFAALVATVPGRHRFPGYMEYALGRWAERVSIPFTFLSYYGAFLAYGILGGLFLENLFGVNPYWGTILFFACTGILFSLPLPVIGRVDFYLTLLLLAFVAIFSIKLLPSAHVSNFASPRAPEHLLPYGILLFALAGHSALPDLFEVIGKNSRMLFKKIIFWSILISALFYLLFIFAVWGASGSLTTPDALSGLKAVAGSGVIALGAVIGFLAVFRAEATLGADLKFLFMYDYKFSPAFSWAFVFFPPLALFAIGFNDLAGILSFVGAVGLGVFALFTIAAAWRHQKAFGEFLGFRISKVLLVFLGGCILVGALAEVIKVISFS